MSTSDRHTSTPKSLCPHAPSSQILISRSQPQAAEKAREPAMAALEVRLAPMGGGRGGDAKIMSHYKQRGRNGGKDGEDGSQAGTVAKLQAAKGYRARRAGPFQGAGMGDEPQVARDRQGARRCPALPHPHLRNGDWQPQPLAQLCPGMGWGWRAGRGPTQMPPSWARWLPACNSDPTTLQTRALDLRVWEVQRIWGPVRVGGLAGKARSP